MSSIDSNLAAKYFGKNPDSKGATELMKRSPSEYRRIKEIALAQGLIVRQVYQDPDYRRRFDPVQLSEETIRLRATVPLAEVQSYYCGTSAGTAKNLGRLATEDPEKYRLIKSAAIAWEVIPPQAMPTAPEPKPVSQFVTVSDADCDKAGLPHGYQTNASGLETIHRVIAEVEAKRIEAQRLTTVSAEKLESDARIDASVAEFGRLLDLNREMAAKQRERDAEVPVV
jgi:hypothetical protein